MQSLRTLANHSRLCMAALLTAVVGCIGVSGPAPPPHSPPPDWNAIATVVGEAYRTEGQARAVVFVETGEVCDSVSPSCVPPDGDIDPELKSVLETELRVKVRLPSAACRLWRGERSGSFARGDAFSRFARLPPAQPRRYEPSR